MKKDTIEQYKYDKESVKAALVSQFESNFDIKNLQNRCMQRLDLSKEDIDKYT